LRTKSRKDSEEFFAGLKDILIRSSKKRFENDMTKAPVTSLQSAQAETVCGGKLDDPADHPRAVFGDKVVYFCTRACLRAFEENPDLFMAGEIEHPLEDE